MLRVQSKVFSSFHLNSKCYLGLLAAMLTWITDLINIAVGVEIAYWSITSNTVLNAIKISISSSDITKI